MSEIKNDGLGLCGTEHLKCGLLRLSSWCQ